MVKNTPGPEPHRAIYGFSFNLFFVSLFWLYLIWVLPYPALGYTKYFYFVPDTYFAFSWPIFVLCGILFFVLFYASLNLAQTADMENPLTITDSLIACKCAEDVSSNQDEENLKRPITPRTHTVEEDMDLNYVSRVLYSRTFRD